MKLWTHSTTEDPPPEPEPEPEGGEEEGGDAE